MTLSVLGQRLRVTAWVVVGFIGVAQVARLPAVMDAMTRWQSSALGRSVGIAVLVLWGAAALVLWCVALRYAWRRHKELGASSIPVLVLVVTNFVGSLVYALIFSPRHFRRESASV